MCKAFQLPNYFDLERKLASTHRRRKKPLCKCPILQCKFESCALPQNHKNFAIKTKHHFAELLKLESTIYACTKAHPLGNYEYWYSDSSRLVMALIGFNSDLVSFNSFRNTLISLRVERGELLRVIFFFFFFLYISIRDCRIGIFSRKTVRLPF